MLAGAAVVAVAAVLQPEAALLVVDAHPGDKVEVAAVQGHLDVVRERPVPGVVVDALPVVAVVRLVTARKQKQN